MVIGEPVELGDARKMLALLYNMRFRHVRHHSDYVRGNKPLAG